MVSVKGRSDSTIPSLTQLCLCDTPITVTMDNEYRPMHVDAWGQASPDVQIMLGGATISMRAIHYDETVLRECIRLAMGGALTEGEFGRAGRRMGSNLPRFAPAGTLDANGVSQPGNNYIGLNISSPVDALPWRFWYTYLAQPPFTWLLGTEKTIVTLYWRAELYTQDPWGGTASQPNTTPGTGALNSILWDRTLDT